MFSPSKFGWDIPSYLWPQIGHRSLWDDTKNGTERELLWEGAGGTEGQAVHAAMHTLWSNRSEDRMKLAGCSLQPGQKA